MKTKPTAPWQILDDAEVYSAPPWIKVHRQQIRLPNGRIVGYHQIVLPDYAIIAAQTADGKFVVERQYKHGIGTVSLFLPGGVIDHGEKPQQAAKRELLEETGYKADGWREIGVYVSNSNYGCGRAHVFISRNARKITEPNSGDLEDMEIVLLDAPSLLRAVRSGKFMSLSSVAAALCALNHRS
ncbi:MAG: NUDIX hydrolase [Verrucomicrobiia bacterium]|jgi:ADP-ribose pyrophosphatase